MKIIMLFLSLAFSFLLHAKSEIRAPIIEGKIQATANCIQCGGRFICGHTDQVVKLNYLRKAKEQSIQAHCAQKSHDISESIRLNGAPRTEEAVRFQDYHNDYVKKIHKFKGGTLSYKEEKGFEYLDFIKYTSKLPRKTKKTLKLRKKIFTANRLKIKKLKSERVLLPVLSIQDFQQVNGSRVAGRLDIEYKEYIKNLLLLHPSELEEYPEGSAQYQKSLSIDKNLKNKFASKFGNRATGAPNLGGGGGSGGPVVAAKAGGPATKGSQKRGIANAGQAKAMVMDEHGNVANAKNDKQRKKIEKTESSKKLLQKSLNEQSAKRANSIGSNNSNTTNNYSYNRPIANAYDFIKALNRTGEGSLCGVGATTASTNTIAAGSRSVASAFGADSSLENGSIVAPEILDTASSALNANSTADCGTIINSVFDSPSLVASTKAVAEKATEEVADEERRERRKRFYASDSTSTTAVEPSIASNDNSLTDLSNKNETIKKVNGPVKPVLSSIGTNQLEIASLVSSSRFKAGPSSSYIGPQTGFLLDAYDDGPGPSNNTNANQSINSIEEAGSKIKENSIHRSKGDKLLSCNSWRKVFSVYTDKRRPSCGEVPKVKMCFDSLEKDFEKSCIKISKSRFISTRKCASNLKNSFNQNTISVLKYRNSFQHIYESIPSSLNLSSKFPVSTPWELSSLLYNNGHNIELTELHSSTLKMLSSGKEDICSSFNKSKTLNSKSLNSMKGLMPGAKFSVEAIKRQDIAAFYADTPRFLEHVKASYGENYIDFLMSSSKLSCTNLKKNLAYQAKKMEEESKKLVEVLHSSFEGNEKVRVKPLSVETKTLKFYRNVFDEYKYFSGFQSWKSYGQYKSKDGIVTDLFKSANKVRAAAKKGDCGKRRAVSSKPKDSAR